jgi:tetratricopeptide (TPR) repeat protein
VGESTGLYGGLGEELRDEKINQDLHQAYSLKSAGQNQKALELYLVVLSQDFIKGSQLEQHIIMRQNAHKNVGEIYEAMENYKLSKQHYTSALKIKENDSWVWNKIGMIEYERYGNLDIAKKCFEAAIDTRPTL